MRSIVPQQLLILVVATCALAVPSTGSGQSSAGPDGSVSLERPVLEYQRHLMQGPDPGPRLRVFESGRVEVHYPVFMKRAGSFELHLPRHELLDLFLDLHSSRFQDFDVRRALVEQQTAEARGETPISPGGAWTFFRWKPFTAEEHGKLSFQMEATREIRWQGLGRSILALPKSDELQRLAPVHQKMEALMEDPRLEPTGAQP